MNGHGLCRSLLWCRLHFRSALPPFNVRGLPQLQFTLALLAPRYAQGPGMGLSADAPIKLVALLKTRLTEKGF